MRTILFLAAGLLVPAASFAAPVQQGTPAGAPSKAPDPNERICKDIAVGSRAAVRRFCATRAEWAIREREDKDTTHLMQRPFQTCAIMGSRRC